MYRDRLMTRLAELENSHLHAEINIVNSHNALVSLNHELNGRFTMLISPLNILSAGTFLWSTESYLTEFSEAHRRLVAATNRYLGHVSHAQQIIDEQATVKNRLAQIQVLLPNGDEVKQREGLGF